MGDAQTYGEVFHAEYAAAQRRFNRESREWGDLAPTEQASISAGALAVAAHVTGTMAQPVAEPARYALVEQMGYRHDIAAVREVTFAGKQMIELTRLDDPTAVRLISPDSLYGITWLTEAEARARAKPMAGRQRRRGRRRMTETPQEHVFVWDYHQQPPLNEIAEVVAELSGHAVTITMPFTERDEQRLVVARGNGERPVVFARFVRTANPKAADHEIADWWRHSSPVECAFWREIEALAGPDTVATEVPGGTHA